MRSPQITLNPFRKVMYMAKLSQKQRAAMFDEQMAQIVPQIRKSLTDMARTAFEHLQRKGIPVANEIHGILLAKVDEIMQAWVKEDEAQP